MNEGFLALAIVVATIGAGVVVTMYRDLIFTGAGQRRPASRPTPASPPKRAPKMPAIVSAPVSASTTPEADAETIAAQTIAKLIRAGAVNETLAIEVAFGVKAGSSKAYTAARSKVKAALADFRPAK